MKTRTWLVAAALVLAASSFSAAQMNPNQVVVDVNFAFVASGTSMAAGKYTIEVAAAGPVVLTSMRGGHRILFPVMTRLGRHDNDAEPELVFDKLGETFHLSEVWLPGQDGYLLLGTKEKHDHRILGGPRGIK